jgi:hypothetical protein
MPKPRAPESACPRQPPRGPAFVALALALAMGATGAGLGQASPTPAQPTHPAPGTASAEGDAASGPNEDPMNDLESQAPPDGKWQVDEDGRDFWVTRLRKMPGTYQYGPVEGFVTYQRWYKWPIVREDDEYFYVKLFRPMSAADQEKLVADREKAKEERRLYVEKTYKFEDHTSDRLAFSAFDQGLPRQGQWRQGFDLADINGDGKLDIVHGPPRKGFSTPVVFLGDGAGHWRQWREAVWPQLPYDYGDAAAADFDGDGLVDVALAVHLRGLLALIQSKPGQFTDASKGLPFELAGGGSSLEGFSSRAVELVDWNGDGRRDLLALGEGARQGRTTQGKGRGLVTSSSYGLAVFLNDGAAGWRPLATGRISGVFGDSFALGEFNGDRRPDVAASSSSMGPRDILFLNADNPEGFEQKELEALRERAWLFAITAGDFDEDGRDDVVASFGSHDDAARWGFELYHRKGGSWRSQMLWVAEGSGSSWALDSGDLDADGHRDFVATTDAGAVMVFLGDGKGGFTREDSAEMGAPDGCRGYAVRLADLDGDGASEVVASFAGETGETEKLLGVAGCPSQGALRAWKAGAKGRPAG